MLETPKRDPNLENYIYILACFAKEVVWAAQHLLRSGAQRLRRKWVFGGLWPLVKSESAIFRSLQKRIPNPKVEK